MKVLMAKAVYTEVDDTMHLYNCWIHHDPETHYQRFSRRLEVQTLCGVTAGTAEGDDFNPQGVHETIAGQFVPVGWTICAGCQAIADAAPTPI
jgi:hypothetical protein